MIHKRKLTMKVLLPAALAVLAGCGDNEGLSPADAQAAAQERVREELGLSPQAALFTNVFVGQPVDGDTVLCGTVEGRKADGTTITPRRFIAATDPERWIKFEPVTDTILSSHQDKFVEWIGTCVPRQEDTGFLG